MKKIIFILTVILSFASCSVTKPLTQDEIRELTTKSYKADYNTVFSSTMSLLQSEGFMITNTDKTTGLINAKKEIANENSELELFFLGFSTSGSVTISVFIDDITTDMTEVKLTIYEGYTDTTTGAYGSRTQTQQNRMVTKPEVYKTWFNNLYVEIDRRQSLCSR